MRNKQPNPLQAGFWLTSQEKGYLLVICAIALIGLAARYFYLINEQPEDDVPAGIGQTESPHE